MTLKELNEKYFELYSNLYAAQPYLPAKQFETMYKALFYDYCKELEVVVGEKELATGQSVFELRFRLSNYLPRRFLFFRNKIAKRMIKQLKAEFMAELADMEQTTKDIKEETKAIQTSEQTEPEETALTVQNSELPKENTKASETE